jgi:hypothetical protein
VFGKFRAIHNEHPILFTERLVHQAQMLGQQGVIIPLALPNELLKRPDLPFRVRSHSQQAQSHRFDILTRDISCEQSTQIDCCPLTLFAPVEKRSKVLVVDK